MPQKSMEEAVEKVIDRVLTQVFGKEATSLLYGHLERNYAVKRNEIGENIELFTKGLEDFLQSGAQIIERKILEDFGSGKLHTFEFNNENDSVDFVIQMRSLLSDKEA